MKRKDNETDPLLAQVPTLSVQYTSYHFPGTVTGEGGRNGSRASLALCSEGVPGVWWPGDIPQSVVQVHSSLHSLQIP